MRRALRFSVLLAAASAAALSAAAPARAQDHATLPVHSRPAEHDGEVSLDVRDYWLHAMPRFGLDATQIGARSVGPGTLPSSGPQHFLAFAIDSKYIYAKRWEFPIFGLVGGGAIGESPRVVTSVDGTMVDMKPWTAGAITLLLPGVGLRFKARRWMFDANVRMVASFVWEQVSFASGGAMDETPPAVSAGTFGARGHAEICRRLDPEERVCLFVEPHLYEFSSMNGGSAGLRWEYGR